MTQAGIKALAFDTGGTVLDWHRGIRTALAETGARHGVERDWIGITNALYHTQRLILEKTGQACHRWMKGAVIVQFFDLIDW